MRRHRDQPRSRTTGQVADLAGSRRFRAHWTHPRRRIVSKLDFQDFREIGLEVFLLLPEGHFVWATLENPRPSVRCPSVRPDFWTVSSINSRLWDNIFDRYNQGIHDHLKSADCPLLSFIGYSAQHAACQKRTFFNEKSTTRKWTIFAKLVIFGSVL